jgi:hypothetical protein
MYLKSLAIFEKPSISLKRSSKRIESLKFSENSFKIQRVLKKTTRIGKKITFHLKFEPD